MADTEPQSLPPDSEQSTSHATYPPPEYLRVSAIKQRIKVNGKRPSAQFLHLLDRYIQRKVDAACRVHNGGKKTLDAAVAGHIGITG